MRYRYKLLFPCVKSDHVFPDCLFSSVSGEFPWCHSVSPELGECVKRIASTQSKRDNTRVRSGICIPNHLSCLLLFRGFLQNLEKWLPASSFPSAWSNSASTGHILMNLMF